MKHIIRFRDMKESDAKDVGPKAYNLGFLLARGVPVPDGFAVPASVYRAHIKAHGLDEKIEKIEKKGASGRLNDVRADLLLLRTAIAGMMLDADLIRDIADGIVELDSDMLAVRSSSTAEDLPEHSFAGQHKTYFVSDIDDCLERLRHCWASLWSERAFDYRTRNGVRHAEAEMSIIVQRLIPSETAGVIFTADPITGDQSEILIESCYGLGEALVSGKVTPDRVAVAKGDMNVVRSEVAEKTTAILTMTRSGEFSVFEEPVDDGKQRLPCLTEKEARDLAAIALKVEALFGAPQDIEWASADGALHIVQARPITTIRKTADEEHADGQDEDTYIWSNVNTGEVLPDVMTPSTWTIVQVVLFSVFQGGFGWLGIHLDEVPLIKRIAGRVYFNVNALAGLVRCFPAGKKLDLTQIFGGAQGKMADQGQIKLSDEDIPNFGTTPLKVAMNAPRAVAVFSFYRPKKAQPFIDGVKKKVAAILDMDQRDQTDEQLADRFSRMLDDTMKGGGDSILFSLMGMVSFSRLDALCKRWFKEEDMITAPHLMAGAGVMDSAAAGLDLWRLAQEASKSAEVRDIVLGTEDAEACMNALERCADASTFVHAWNTFMRNHGHHARGEIELYTKRWAESPDYILKMVRSYIRSSDIADPLEVYRRRSEESKELAGTARKQLNPFRRFWFDLWLKRAREGAMVRENAKSALVSYLWAIRLTLLEAGRRLSERGVIDERDDVFFLEIGELQAILRGTVPVDLKGLIKNLKEDYELSKSITPPPVVVGKLDLSSFTPTVQGGLSKQMKGLPVSPGIAVGRARVILRSDSDEEMQPGEILVAPFTDPGWTPYFTPAAGIVMDMGGMLSHGSIIAREYGIPAVVNVGPATTVIKTGQMLKVDGAKGEVTILS